MISVSVTAIASNKSTAYANINYDCDKCLCICHPLSPQIITPATLFSHNNNLNHNKQYDRVSEIKIETDNIHLINLQT